MDALNTTLRRLRLAAGALLILSSSILGCASSEDSSPKILVIGLDGATFDLLHPWMEAGHLPNIKALYEDGLAGDLQSVIPALSPPAWTSAVTGVNPGHHGIYDFFRFDPDSLVGYTETASSRRVPGLWTFLSEAGKRVGTLNIPITDPPDEVNGFQVGGFPHGDLDGFTYPAGIEADLEQKGYLLDKMGGALIKGEEHKFKKEIFDTFHARHQAALALGEKYSDLDLYWVVFTGTDRVQHFFWKFMEEEHPFHDPELAKTFGSTILELWKETDVAVGDLVSQGRAQAAEQGREFGVLLLSDHGFGGVHRAFRPQSFLRNPPPGQEPITSSYSLETNAALLYVPVEGRERGATNSPAVQQELVDDILTRVENVRDPKTGLSPTLFGAKREDLYRGRYVDKAPDVLFVARPPYYLIHEEGDKEPFGTPEFTFSGHHHMQGILIANGPMFLKGEVEARQSLLDIAPTLLYLADLPVPSYMEGNVLEAWFDPTYLERNPVTFSGEKARETGGPNELIPVIPYVQ